MAEATFLTQGRVNLEEYPAEEIGELEALVSGVTQTSQSTLLLKKRKEMREVDDALEFMNEEFETRMEACEERQAEFERKQVDMRTQVARFEKFIQENDVKRQRAEIKARSEHRLLEATEQRIRELDADLQRDVETKRRLEEQVERLAKYKRFLELAVDASESEYEEIADVLNRFKTLQDANQDLKTQVEQGDALMDGERQKLAQLRRETQNKLLVMNSCIHGHQKHIEKLRSEFFRLDQDREQSQRSANERSQDAGQVVMSIKNLHQRCVATARHAVPQLAEKDHPQLTYLTACLRFVEERIKDLGDIRDGYRAEAKHAAAADAARTQAKAAAAAAAAAAAQPQQHGGGGGRADGKRSGSTSGGPSQVASSAQLSSMGRPSERESSVRGSVRQ